MPENYGAPIWVVHRADLQRVLRVGAEREGVQILTGHCCSDVDFEQSKLLVRSVKTGGEEWIEGDVIIAADGIKSIMREKMLALSGLKDEGEAFPRPSRLAPEADAVDSSTQVGQLEMLPTALSFLARSSKTTLNCFSWSQKRSGFAGWVQGELRSGSANPQACAHAFSRSAATSWRILSRITKYTTWFYCTPMSTTPRRAGRAKAARNRCLTFTESGVPVSLVSVLLRTHSTDSDIE